MTVRRLGIGSALAAGSLVAWVLTARQVRGMDMGPTADLGGFVWYTGVWVAMTAAMMLPSTAPTVLLVDRLSPRATPLFLAGYLVAWTAFGLAVYGVTRMAVDAGAGGWHASGPLIAAAGLYQLTPLKRMCLSRCRSPLAFLRARVGRSTLRTGVEHGLYCIGCCAGLMVVLFALGMMSIGWMVVVATGITAEKVAPGGERLATPIAVGLVAAGAWVTLR